MLKKFLFISIISIVKVFCSELFVASLSDNEKTYSDLNEKQKDNITAIKAMYQEHIEKQETCIKNNAKYYQTINTVILSEICRAFVDINPYEISGRYYQNSFIVEFLQSEGFLKPENFTRAHFNYLLLVNVLKFMRDSKDEAFSDNTIDTVVEKIKSAYKNDDSVYDYSSNICQSKLKLAAYDIKQYFKELELYDFIKNIKQGNYKVDSYYSETYEIVARGMQNVGGTCYFNSVIQLLVTSKELVSLVNFLAKDPRNKASGYLKELFNKFRKHDSCSTNQALKMNQNEIKKFYADIRFKPTDKNHKLTTSIGNQSASELITCIIEAISEEDTKKYNKEYEYMTDMRNAATKELKEYINNCYRQTNSENTKQDKQELDKYRNDLSKNDKRYKELESNEEMMISHKKRIENSIFRRTAFHNTLGCDVIYHTKCKSCGAQTERHEIENQIFVPQSTNGLINKGSAYKEYDFQKCFSEYMQNNDELNNVIPCDECNSKEKEVKINRKFHDLLKITLANYKGDNSCTIKNIPDELIVNGRKYELIGFMSGGLGHWKCYAIREGKLWKLDDSSAKIANDDDEEKGMNHARDILYMVKK